MALDAEGWTILATSGDSRVVYVSSSGGNDSNDGLSTGAPKATIAAGLALLRDGYPDWLMLKCGDNWSEELGCPTSGRSASEPVVVTSYSTGARPQIRRTGSQNGFYHGGGPTARRQYVCYVDLHFVGRYGDPTTGADPVGFRMSTPIDNLLVEGCCFERFCNGVSTGGPDGTAYDMVFRRNVVMDNHAIDSTHSQGAYFNVIDGLLIEENIFDKNGWIPGDPYATGGTIFRHGIYVQSDCTGVVVQNNWLMNSPSHGLQLRPGGSALGNIVAKCSIGILVANDSDPTGQKCNNNIITDGHDIDGSTPRGWGVEIQDFDAGEVGYNLMAKQGTAGEPAGIYVTRAPGSGIEIHHNVIWDWLEVDRFGVLIVGTAAEVVAVNLHDNDVQEHNDTTCSLVWTNGSGVLANVDSANNRFWRSPGGGSPMYDAGSSVSISTWKTSVGDTTSTETNVSYTDTTRTIGGYNGYLGGTATYDALATALRAQRKGAWDADLETEPAAAWIRAGWDMTIPGGGEPTGSAAVFFGCFGGIIGGRLTT